MVETGTFNSGAFGVLYAGMQEETGRAIAVKRIKAKSPREIQELTTLKRLRHENYVRTTSCGTNNLRWADN